MIQDKFKDVLDQIDNSIKHIKEMKLSSKAKEAKLFARVDELVELLYQPQKSIDNKKSDDNDNSNTNKTKEKKKISYRLNGFHQHQSPVWKAICQKFGEKIKQQQLYEIAVIIASHQNLILDRDAKRRKGVLIKWFDENSKSVLECLPYIDFMDQDHNLINFD